MSSPSKPAPLVEPPGGRGPAPKPYYPPMVMRRHLKQRDRLAAAGIGLAVGALAAYVAALWMERQPLEEAIPRPPRPGRPPREAAKREAATVRAVANRPLPDPRARV